MLRLALLLRERLVGDALHEVLQEPVLPAFGGSGIRLYLQDLLAHERGEQRFELVAPDARHGGEAGLRERLAHHSGVLQDAPLLSGKSVQPRRDQRVQRLRHLEILDLGRESVLRAFLPQQSAVEQHANRLHRVQGHAFGTL